ncbi:MAG: phosphoribosylformylglycinamidine synthase [Deltaproteobacteria bacterium]|nr:phosphoribosylformylglycinamidine synthase [Deltaproteobacteria bacterium]
MIHRFEIALKDTLDDPRGDATQHQARNFLALGLEKVRTRHVIKFDADLDDAALVALRAALTDPVVEVSALGQLPLPDCDWVITVGFRPGVTDNVGRTAAVFLCDLLKRTPSSWATPPHAFTETLYLIWGAADEAEVRRLASELLANPLIQHIEVQSSADYRAAHVDLSVPRPGDQRRPEAPEIVLPHEDAALLALSRERTLALTLPEMKAIQAQLEQPEVRAQRERVGLPAGPTDLELEVLAQTWSEHCKHKIFNATIHYRDEDGGERTIRSLFHTAITSSTKRLAKKLDWLVSVFHDNAGIVAANKDWNLVFKVETHNSPSALDPYGGSITGIVGVNRDPLGTGIGAELLTNTWGYCFGSPFYQGDIPEGLHHPRRIRDGVHRGVIDGGNQSGIPYSRGFEVFDDRFIGKPLVFCGTVGVLPKTIKGRPTEDKEVRPGDVVVMVGGRIGKDGIHGATFSSEALQKESPSQAVQIGDPITQRMMAEFLIEARDAGLYRTITDNGAGGLSSSVGEMAERAGGAELELEQAPLKYAGLMPWEIIVSEAQERMTLAVPQEDLEALLDLATRREVEATAIGRFTNDGFFRLRYAGQVVGELPLSFLHGGCPLMELDARWEPPQLTVDDEVNARLASTNTSSFLLDMIASLELCSKELTCRQYDHEVKGLSVVKPLTGMRGDVPADATVMRVRHGENWGVVLADAIAPRLSDIDPGLMTRWVFDLAVRRIVAAGGTLGRIAGLDNFCWPDPVQSASTPDGEQKLAGLVRSCDALAEMVEALEVPLISGKDSMKNDSLRGGVKISIPPTLLISTMGWMDDVSQAMDLTPCPGDELIMIGETCGALGGSSALALLHERDGQGWMAPAPRTSGASSRATCKVVETILATGLAHACHAPHAGGLALAALTLSLAANTGVEIDLDALPAADGLGWRRKLFAESSGRFLLSIETEAVDQVVALAAQAGVPAARIGMMTSEQYVVLRAESECVAQVAVSALKERYEEPFRDL